MRKQTMAVLLACALAVPALEETHAQAYYPPGATLPGGGIATVPGYRPPGATQPDTGYITPGPGYFPPGALVPGVRQRGIQPRSLALPKPSVQPRPQLLPSPTPAPVTQQWGPPRRERARPPARNLKECLERWNPTERLSQTEWEATCRRLEVSGRVRIQ